MITERFMQLGDWDLQLSPETPLSVRQLLRPFDHIVVTPSRFIGAEDVRWNERSNLLNAARWRGVLLEYGEDRTNLRGNGLLYVLGNANQDGPFMVNDPTAWKWNEHLIHLNAEDELGGLTLKAVVDNPAATWPNAGGSSDDLPYNVLQRISYLAGVLGAEFYVNALGEFHSGGAGSASLWQTTPRVILRRNHDGRDIDLIGLRLVDWNVTYDVWDWVPHATVFTPYTIGSAVLSGGPTYQGADGRGNVSFFAFEWSDTIDNLDDANARAAALLSQKAPHDAVQVSVDTYDPGRWMKPGDYVWAFDPINKVYDEAQFTAYHGEHVNPAKLRLFGMSWPIREGMGVYRLGRGDANDTPNVVDLTDYVIYDDGPCVLEVGAPNRSYNE